MAHAKLGQQQVADRAGVSQSTIGEAYKNTASKYTVQIAMACGVRAEWLATGEGDMLTAEQKMAPEALEAAQIINGLDSKKQREWMLQVVKDALEGLELAKADRAEALARTNGGAGQNSVAAEPFVSSKRMSG